MFDAVKALRPLDGTTWATGDGLRESLGKVFWEHRSELSPWFHRGDLLDLIRSNDWLRMTADDQIQLRLPPEKANA